LIARGADYEGIKVDEGSCAVTRRALDAFGLTGRVLYAAASNFTTTISRSL